MNTRSMMAGRTVLAVARAFDLGASDYIIKPFSPAELLARIRATLRTWAASEPRALAEHRINDAE